MATLLEQVIRECRLTRTSVKMDADRIDEATAAVLGSEARTRDAMSQLTAALSDTSVKMEALIALLTPSTVVVPPPEQDVSLRVTAETQIGETSMLTFVVDTSALTDQTDVVSRELTVTTAEGVQPAATVSLGQAEVGPYSGAQDSEVQTSLVNIDDAGNRSEPRVQTFTLRDTIAPESPADVGIRVTGET